MRSCVYWLDIVLDLVDPFEIFDVATCNLESLAGFIQIALAFLEHG